MIAIALLLQGATAAPAPAGAETVQSMFEAASAALDRSDWPAALAGYERLEQRLAKGGSPRSLAIVRVRKARVLFQLDRDDEALAATTAGLAALPAGDATLAEDRRAALLLAARLEEARFDPAGAARDFRLALDIAGADSDTKLSALGGIARTTMFDDAPAAIAAMDQALAIVAADPARAKSVGGRLRSLRGRALMNAGRLKEADAELLRAVKELGGLTMKVDLTDVAARSDLAINSMLQKDDDKAKLYMAYTGAGRGDGFATVLPSQIDLPRCGDDGIRPDDVAVVQFSVTPDGRIGGVTPIYASRQGPVAIAFARKVAGWSWTAEQAAKIPPFYRAGTRLELRCTTSVDGPSPVALLEPKLAAWLRSVDSSAPETDQPERFAATRLATDTAELAAREQRFGGQATQLVGPLYRIGVNPVAPLDVARASFDRALVLARRAGAPVAAEAQIALARALLFDPNNYRSMRDAFAAIREVADDPRYLADAQTGAALRLIAADRLAYSESKLAEAYVQQIVGDARLAPRDPARTAALLRQAAYLKTAGDENGARAAFEATGLTEGQCALFDARPTLRKKSSYDKDFPQEAMHWGFEGWALSEFDVAADGGTRNVRAVAAFPPFIFDRAANGILTQAMYTQSYRPGGGLGCGGQRQSVRFLLPGASG